MAKITITKEAKTTDFEAKLNLKYGRIRNDYLELLQNLNQGKKLFDLFPIESIMNNVRLRLKNLEMIDSGDKLTERGKRFLTSPIISEIEVGTFKVHSVMYKIADETFNLIYKINRKLADDNSILSQFMLPDYQIGNQISLDSEKVFFSETTLTGKSKMAYISQNNSMKNVLFNLVEGRYEIGGEYYDCGVSLSSKLLDYAKDILNDNPYGEFDLLSTKCILAKGIEKLSDSELVNRSITKYTKQDIVLENIPFVINDIMTANQYLYFLAYQLLVSQFYNTNDLNMIFNNEVLHSGVFTKELEAELSNFEYRMMDFHKYLSKEKSDKLQYRLRVIELLLGENQVINSFRQVQDYSQLVNAFIEQVNPHHVDKLYVVMGYAFAKNSKNKIIDFYESFNKRFENIEFIKKGNAYEESKTIAEYFTNNNVAIKEYKQLREHYHDRYLIFKMKDRSYRIYLVTCEIGELFKPGSSDKMGSITSLDYSELIKADASNNLISIIEGGNANG